MMTQMSDWWFSGKEADRAAAVSNNWHMKRKWGNFSLIFSCIQHICKTFKLDIYDIWRENKREQIQWKPEKVISVAKEWWYFQSCPHVEVKVKGGQ